jgi:hypothetical protein
MRIERRLVGRTDVTRANASDHSRLTAGAGAMDDYDPAELLRHIREGDAFAWAAARARHA